MMDSKLSLDSEEASTVDKGVVSFRILGGKNLSKLFSSSTLLSNPIVGVMIGILVTVLVQSSATSTSIIVSLVSAGVEVRHAIPMILGSNVGTSVTNTIVSITQASDREVFRRAFAAATVHDMFNWLSVFVLMSLEMATGFLEVLTSHIVNSMPLNGTSGNGGPDILKPIVKPFTNAIVRVDKKVLIGWSVDDPLYKNVTSVMQKDCGESECNYLLALLGFNGLNLSDTIVGVFLLIFALGLLIICLLVIMKSLNSMLGSSMAIFIQKVINAEFPYARWLTGYIAMVIGAVITILVRSSSIFTSTLTPLCGMGLVTLETAYPMTLGSNIGTTTTSIIASLAAEGKYLRPSVQIAFVHLFFNIVGILIFYPIPAMRWPLPLARKLGDITSRYRWFAGAYLLFMFFLLPAAIFILSMIGPYALYGVLGPSLILLFIVIGVTLVQNYKPSFLPPVLRNWNFLPIYLRSLEPIDNFLKSKICFKLCRCRNCFTDPESGKEDKENNGNLVSVHELAQQPSILSNKNERIAMDQKKKDNEEVAILANSNLA
ncbi:SLC34A [Lepeophtheirus salmonis]|uniref:SLC34A n=1 Tax=Lepeophtheirus salmonis TaxID=72036 RepID=A0A7R8H4R5_LEPSM|nr:SLC34A [Lepeophtheirus salmonis]CAF2852847.1 SLC34A [Lepeophtheirus salmonis]